MTAAARIYIVEDEALIAMELSDRLGRLGYGICGVAAAGEKALPEILASMPDLVLMDIRLAGKLSGVEIAAMLRTQADIAVVFLTAYSDPELLRAAGETEPQGYLVKPFDERSLHTTVEMALYKHRMERALRLANEELEERVRARTEQLGEVSGRLQDLFDNASDLIQTVAPDGRILLVNAAWRQVLGYSETEIATLSIFAVLAPECIEPFTGLRRRLLAGEELGLSTLTYIARDGRRVELEADLSVHLKDGVPAYVRGILRDVTARKAAETALRASEENLAVTLASIGDAVLATDAEGRVSRMNRVAEQMTGWTQLEARGRPVEEVFNILNEDTRTPALIPVHDVLKTGTAPEPTSHRALVARDGAERSIADSAAPIRDAAGRIVGVVLVFRDETEARDRHRRLEVKRQMLDAIRLVNEQFISGEATKGAWDLLLAASMAGTDAECGFIGEVTGSADGALAIRTDAMAGFTWNFDADRAVPAGVGTDAEQLALGRTLGAALEGFHPALVALPVWRELPGVARHREDLHFLTVPILVKRKLVGVVGIAERRAEFDAQALVELQPVLATYGGLIAFRRNQQRRRDAERALLALNADLEGEVQRRTSALLESEQKYATLVGNISDGIIRDDLDGRLTYANPRFLRWFGFEGRELQEISPADYIAPEWLPGVLDRHRRRVRGERVSDRFDFQGLRSDGSRIWLDVFVTTVVEHGRIVGTQSVIRDVTDQKQSELALRIISTDLVTLEGEPFYAGLVERLSGLLECEIAYVSREDVDAASGWSLVASCVDGVVSGAGPFPVDAAAREAIAGGGSVMVASGAQQRYPTDAELRARGVEAFAVVPLMSRRGVRFGYLGVVSRRPLPHPDSVEAILHLFGIALATEMERQRNLRLFHDLVEFSPDGIVMCDRGGRITLANRQAEKMFGWTREELIGQRVEMLVPAAGRSAHAALRGQYVESAEARPMGDGRPTLEAQHRDGSVFPVEISLSPLETDGGTMVAAAIRNISERRALEQQANRRQRLDAIGTLAGGIAHDLNNALGPILMGADILRGQYPDVPDIVDTIEQSANRAAGMVRQLLTFAKGADGERVAVRLDHIIGEMEKIITSTFPRNIHLSVRAGRDVPAVRGDATQLHQVLLNLCVNARDAMPGGGQLGLELRAESVDAPTASRMRDADTKAGTYVVLRVRDTGSGIPAAVRDKIFDPFFTTKGPDKGTGLGLSTVLGIVKGHGGFVRVESEISRGSRFSVYLPADSVHEEAPAAPRERLAFAGRGEMILYVDDEAALRDVASRVLLRLHFTPLTAVDGTDGLLQVAQRGAELHAIITDLHMPHMDGVAFVRAARRMLPTVPIIVASGRVDDEAETALRALGVNGLLSKPFTQGQLAEALSAALGAGGPHLTHDS